MADQTTQVIDPMANPALHNAVVEKLMGGAEEPRPTIAPPADGFLRLPGGLVDGERVLTEVEVQELSGAHEERLSKVRGSSEPGRWLQTLLECGTVSIGGQKATPDLLEQLLVGDRDYLVMAIRNATYGPEVEFGTQTCPQCMQEFEMTIDLHTVPVRPLKSGSRQFEVPLRKGGHATVRIPNGSDQMAYVQDLSLTDSERNSVLLSHCVQALTNARGEQSVVAGFPSLVRDSLGIADRRRILEEINNRQPGPQYNEVEYEHECGEKLLVPLGMMHLFPGL